MAERVYEIRGRDGFYVARQFTAGTLELVVGHDNVAGGLWNEWVNDNESTANIKKQARRMIREARKTNPELNERNNK